MLTATSKMNALADMDAVSTSFGFRGEALGSVSDVSILEIVTKTHGIPNGYRKIIKARNFYFLVLTLYEYIHVKFSIIFNIWTLLFHVSFYRVASACILESMTVGRILAPQVLLLFQSYIFLQKYGIYSPKLPVSFCSLEII